MRALGLHTITTTCYRVLHDYKTAKIAKNIVWNSLQLAYSPDELQFGKCAATISRLARLIFDSRALYSAHESKWWRAIHTLYKGLCGNKLMFQTRCTQYCARWQQYFALNTGTTEAEFETVRLYVNHGLTGSNTTITHSQCLQSNHAWIANILAGFGILIPILQGTRFSIRHSKSLA